MNDQKGNPPEKDDELSKAIALAQTLLKEFKTLEPTCAGCEKCKDAKKTLNKIVTVMAKIITIQTENIKILEVTLLDSLDAIEKIYETQSDPDTQH